MRLIAGTRSGRAVVRAFSGGVTSGDLSVDIGGAAAGFINLTANPSNVPASGGTSALLAVVFDVDGNRLSGVSVSFTSTAGTLSSTSVVTNSQGEATTTITTNRDATVTASTGGVQRRGRPGGGHRDRDDHRHRRCRPSASRPPARRSPIRPLCSPSRRPRLLLRRSVP